MPSDPTVQVAIIGIITTFITTGGVVVVALVNNRRERTGAAGEGVESTLRERIALRDEQILDLRADKVALEKQLAAAIEEIAEKTALLEHITHELESREEAD